ncbi:uncharacterized protein LOC136028420 [Artemia franciscana]|uniref:uncharacterized protein LOC136028420 n=1 Tax=Artemia franciscana TaxID=6661 RepID=UPI0032D9EF68
MAASPVLARAKWTILNQFTLPLITQGSGKLSVRGLLLVNIPVTLFLDTLFEEEGFPIQKRSVAHSDQDHIFHALEFGLSTIGVNGRACLLRTICELPSHPIMNSGLMGEILTIILTPKQGMNDFFRDYLESKGVDLVVNSTSKSCERLFSDCPFSVFDVLKKWSKSPYTEQIIYLDDENEKNDADIRGGYSSVESSENEL